ncbi:MAG: SAM-dependent chlorinase/fluorinase [Candidatus Wallbacteria bacterium]|nr:SAM-dependent chlorinase/fluorinase [Candidatus Wallbacteria bacterium]
MRPILTFLSDFGGSDPYVAAVKGVLLVHCADLTLVDVTHGVPAHDIFEGAMLLREACGAFPAGTFHLAVVDPGVGGSRPALVVKTDRYTFMAPDNGLLSPALERETGVQPYRIQPTWEVPSSTFHARDVFAQAAGRLLSGQSPEAFLERAADYVRLAIPQPKRLETQAGELERWEGAVLRIDTFGNIITNLPRERFGELLDRHPFSLAVPGGTSLTRLASTYETAPPGAPVVIWGSSGTLEIAIREYSAARVLGVTQAGARLEVAILKGEPE